jgi:hypothetical protein
VVAGRRRRLTRTKVAEAGDVGTAVHVPLSGVAKFTLTVGVYSGVDTTTTPEFARATGHHVVNCFDLCSLTCTPESRVQNPAHCLFCPVCRVIGPLTKKM